MRRKQELNKIETENLIENIEEWEMKGQECSPSHYPISPYFFLYFHSQQVFLWLGGENANEERCELVGGHRAMNYIVLEMVGIRELRNH
jgi:hypothetical protein